MEFVAQGDGDFLANVSSFFLGGRGLDALGEMNFDPGSDFQPDPGLFGVGDAVHLFPSKFFLCQFPRHHWSHFQHFFVFGRCQAFQHFPDHGDAKSGFEFEGFLTGVGDEIDLLTAGRPVDVVDFAAAVVDAGHGEVGEDADVPEHLGDGLVPDHPAFAIQVAADVLAVAIAPHPVCDGAHLLI